MTSPTTRLPAPDRPAPTVRGAGASHRGLVRAANEDAILTDPAGALWAVADGMGGHGHGELAADIVIDHLARLPHGAGAEAVAAALAAANAAVRAAAGARGLGAIGATVAAVLVGPGRAAVLWAGDSRVCRLRGDRFETLTRDHSLVQELVDQGRLAPEAARGHPEAHVVTRAVGAAPALELGRRVVDLAPGDVLLLCSDGLSGCVPEPEIAAILAASPEPEAACRRLLERALALGAPDNVSAVVVRIGAPGLP